MTGGQQQPLDISRNASAAPAPAHAVAPAPAPAAGALHSIFGSGSTRTKWKGDGHVGSSTVKFPADVICRCARRGQSRLLLYHQYDLMYKMGTSVELHLATVIHSSGMYEKPALVPRNLVERVLLRV